MYFFIGLRKNQCTKLKTNDRGTLGLTRPLPVQYTGRKGRGDIHSFTKIYFVSVKEFHYLRFVVRRHLTTSLFRHFSSVFRVGVPLSRELERPSDGWKPSTPEDDSLRSPLYTQCPKRKQNNNNFCKKSCISRIFGKEFLSVLLLPNLFDINAHTISEHVTNLVDQILCLDGTYIFKGNVSLNVVCDMEFPD